MWNAFYSNIVNCTHKTSVNELRFSNEHPEIMETQSPQWPKQNVTASREQILEARLEKLQKKNILDAGVKSGGGWVQNFQFHPPQPNFPKVVPRYGGGGVKSEHCVSQTDD